MIYIDLFVTFFIIGLFTIGGGYAMIPMITQQVTEKGWLSMDMLVNFIGVAESTPGPFAINIATFIGNTQGGIFGSICATMGVVLPSFLIILVIAKGFESFKDNFYVKSALYGLGAAVIGLIISATYSIIVSNIYIKNGTGFPLDLKAVFIIITTLAVMKVKKIHPIFVVVISAMMGIILY